jgi:hypothetical protein
MTFSGRMLRFSGTRRVSFASYVRSNRHRSHAWRVMFSRPYSYAMKRAVVEEKLQRWLTQKAPSREAQEATLEIQDDLPDETSFRVRGALHNKSGLHQNTMTCTISHADGDSGSGRLSRDQGVDGG